ncbi:MAG: ABC transporter permease [Mycoplasmatales bacterium]
MITIAKRVFKEIISDKRTIALLLLAPLFLLTLISTLFQSDYRDLTIGYVDELDSKISSEKIDYKHFNSIDELESAINTQAIDGGLVSSDTSMTMNVMNRKIEIPQTKYSVYVGGLNPLIDPYVQSEVINSLHLENKLLENKQLNDNFDLNDYILVFFMQFVISFFSFLTVGISFLRERNKQTLTRMLTFNISKTDIVLGYFIGFGFIAIVQTILIQVYSVYVLGLNINGNIFNSIVANFIFAFTGIALGALISSLAKSEFQIMQFIPLVIIPQLLFSNILPYGEVYSKISAFFPITYGFDMQKQILLLNTTNISFDLFVLIGFIFILASLTILTLRKIRKV